MVFCFFVHVWYTYRVNNEVERAKLQLSQSINYYSLKHDVTHQSQNSSTSNPILKHIAAVNDDLKQQQQQHQQPSDQILYESGNNSDKETDSTPNDAANNDTGNESESNQNQNRNRDEAFAAAEAKILGIIGDDLIEMPCNVGEWTIDNVCEWVASLGLDSYSEDFQYAEIDGRKLLKLHVSDIKEIITKKKDVDYFRAVLRKLKLAVCKC